MTNSCAECEHPATVCGACGRCQPCHINFRCGVTMDEILLRVTRDYEEEWERMYPRHPYFAVRERMVESKEIKVMIAKLYDAARRLPLVAPAPEDKEAAKCFSGLCDDIFTKVFLAGRFEADDDPPRISHRLNDTPGGNPK